MDFEPRFDCCEACNSISYQCQNNKPPIQIQGQGDCKCNIELQGSENVWMALEKGKKLRSKIARELNDLGSKAEQQKKYLDGRCYCFTKQDFPDKLKCETKLENKDFGNFENSNYFWDTPNWASKPERCYMSEGSKLDLYSNADKLLADNIFEFEEKVDFLFRIFKDYGQKSPTESFTEQAKSTEVMFKDVAHLFDFNKRLCAAEEGIEKLALILEDLVKDSSEKKTNGSMAQGEHLDFEEMSVSQRINYLKSRNDLMLSFMKAFLKAGSSEDTYSRTGSTLNEYELKQKPLNSKLDHGENLQAKDLNRVRVMETLRKLRMRMTEVRQKKSQHCGEQQAKIRNERKGEAATKYAKNKLEVISEQAELALSDESETAGDDFRIKNPGRTINDKLSEINEESDESDLSVPDVTFKILSEESEFFNPLDKLFFSNSTDKKFGKGSNIQILKEKNDEGDIAINFDPSSEVSYIYCDGDNSEKTLERNKTTLPGLYTKKDLKEPLKREKNSLEKASKDLCKQNGASCKKPEDYVEDKIQSARKLLQKNSHTVFPGKGSRNGCSVPEICSPSREDRKKETRGPKEQRQRPMTDPSSHRRTLTPTGLKPLVPDKYSTKISGINNVKSKNKILLSKKSCVQTS